MTQIVRAVLIKAPKQQPWLTLHEIMQRARELADNLEQGAALALLVKHNAVASALANLEAPGHVEVFRSRKPYLYRWSLGEAQRRSYEPRPTWLKAVDE